jgi:hypothetical protein
LDPSKNVYKGHLANFLIATKLLRKHGAKADVVAIFQLHYESLYEQLPNDVEQILTNFNIQIVRYSPTESDLHLNARGLCNQQCLPNFAFSI